MRTLSNVAHGRMQAMPRHVSLGCTSLVARALVRDASSRISLRGIADDVWLRETAALARFCCSTKACREHVPAVADNAAAQTLVSVSQELMTTTTCVQGQQLVERTVTQQSAALRDEPSPALHAQQAPGLVGCSAADGMTTAASSATHHCRMPSSASSDASSSKAWRSWGGLCATKPVPAREAGGWMATQRLMSIKRFLGFGMHAGNYTEETVTGEGSI